MSDIDNIISWANSKVVELSAYVPSKKIAQLPIHYLLLLGNVISAIKTGDLNAIELGCDLLILRKNIPFGRTLKSNILVALKRNIIYIDQTSRNNLSELAVYYLNSQYPARECKDLCKLISKFEINYVSYVIENVSSTTREAERWVGYLNKRSSKK